MSRIRRGFVRAFAFTGAAALVAVGVQVTLGSQTAFAATQCLNGSFSNTTISGDLVVPSGSVCTLNNVTVTGNVTVKSSGELDENGGTIYGNVTAQPGSTVSPNEPSEDCSDDPSTPPCAPKITVKGSVTLNGANFKSPNCPNISVGSTLTLNATDPSPYNCISVAGDTSITNNNEGLGFAHSKFGGNVTITGNNGGILFGDPVGNSVTGQLKVKNNPSPVEIENNTIGNGAICSGNADLTFQNNTVTGAIKGCLD